MEKREQALLRTKNPFKFSDSLYLVWEKLELDPSRIPHHCYQRAPQSKTLKNFTLCSLSWNFQERLGFLGEFTLFVNQRNTEPRSKIMTKSSPRNHHYFTFLPGQF